MALYQKYGDRVKFIVVDVQDRTNQSVFQLLNTLRMQGQSVNSIPSMFFIDGNGQVVDRVDAVVPLAELEKKIKKLL